MWRRDRAAPRVQLEVGKTRLRASSLSRSWLSQKRTPMWARWSRPKSDWDLTGARGAGSRKDLNFPVKVSPPKSCSNRQFHDDRGCETENGASGRSDHSNIDNQRSRKF